MTYSLRDALAALIGLGVLIWISYGISLPAAWHIDDIPNIVRNQKIQLAHLEINAIVDTFFAGPAGNLYRPLPMASFALNWYLHGSEVFGYRLVNILLHCVNAFLLYLIVRLLLKAPRFSDTYSRAQIHWIAFTAAALWALNPMQVQAVTYVVQRMASMAAMFFLLGIYFFIRYRNSPSGKAKRGFLVGCVLAYLFAIFSKENAVLFPVSIYLINLVFYTEDFQRPGDSRWWGMAAAALLLTLAIGVAIFWTGRGDPLRLLGELYANRPFTLTQRVLTECRILLLYLSKLFFPLPSRLSFCHDITVSTSIVTPWTTLPSILLIVAGLVLAIVGYRKTPLLSFALLFFFINHGVESTILPLELVFQHRNYLPSMFLFLPVASGAVKLVNALPAAGRVGRVLVVGLFCLAIGVLVNWTFGRNMVWLSAKTLWEDEIQKHPQIARPYHNLAWGYYQAQGKYGEAMALYRKALKLKAHTPLETASTLNNMGRISYLLGDYDHARHYFQRAIRAYPGLKLANVQLAATLIQMNLWQDALAVIDSELQKDPWDPLLLKLKGIVLLNRDDDLKALSFLSESLKQKPDAVDTRSHIGIVLGRMGRYEEARQMVAINGSLNEVPLQHFLVASEIEKMRDNPIEGKKMFDQVIQIYGIERVKRQLLFWKKDNLAVRMDYDAYLSQIERIE